jgi:carbamoyl-phosphate synthase large subunit
MPRRDDIKCILIIGSGPIVIGQGCEFDYSGVQACRALKEEGYRVVLINSNPATIMTDPEFADATYVEPITPAAVEKILQRERDAGTPIDSLLPTLGGQTGLNTGMACHDQGILARFGVKMIGADRDAIMRGEDRQIFKDLMLKIGLNVPNSGLARDVESARKILEAVGLPAIIRPAFTLGGTGGGIAYNSEEFETIIARGLDASPVHEVLVEQSVIGWKEYELEVMRDRKDNVVVICAIENIDPMGVHTGDSITVAPTQTLTDKEYQRMRDAAIAVIRAVGVETGGSNIQFGVNPVDGAMVVIEMNPRVSRSSALASKATGFPIAKIAAKLAVGYTLDELPNDITRKTVACFEPTIDYCVVKIPRWTFEKFPDADETLTTQMKSVGEAMAIGRTFKEALQKGLRSMEVKRFGLGLDGGTGETADAWLASRRPRLEPRTVRPEEAWPIDEAKLLRKLSIPSQGRLYFIRYALKMGWTVAKVHELTRIDPWFLEQIRQLVEFEEELVGSRKLFPKPTTGVGNSSEGADAGDSAALAAVLLKAKQWGYSDVQIAEAWGGSFKAQDVRRIRLKLNIAPVYKLVDTCAAEFEAATPYYYSTYETPYTVAGQSVRDDEIRLTEKPKVIIIGGGPNRIGQGIEFDYCCVQAAFAMRELGLESVMINSNPETVSTDYDTSDMLFFEPLTHEDILSVCERVNGRALAQRGGLLKGVIVQFGGQTPLNLARGLEAAGVPILGTAVRAIWAAGDREQFRTLLADLGLRQPANGIARNITEAREVARKIGYPVLVRPSFVLGGRAMEIVSDESQLNHFMDQAVEAAGDAPILIDKFLDAAVECDVDCLADFDPSPAGDGGAGGAGGGGAAPSATGRAVIIGVMEHIEEAGIHSGDSACALPPYSLPPTIVATLKDQTRALARALRVRGLMNVQYAIRDGQVYVIEVNPRASRTVPFVGKATSVPWAKLAAMVMAGKSLDELGIAELAPPDHVSVKESVFPFSKFPGVDVILGPEMRSTGEVMGIDTSFAVAFAKSQIAAGADLPTSGAVFISVRDADKSAIVPIARALAGMGFTLISTGGTHAALTDGGVAAQCIARLAEGRPNVRDLIKSGQVQLIINTATHKGPVTDEGKIRALALLSHVPIVTTVTGASAAANAIAAMRRGQWDVKPLQAYHRSGAAKIGTGVAAGVRPGAGAGSDAGAPGKTH